VDNKTIGKFQLTGIPPAPRGMPQVEVTFDIDANGILHVSAKDRATAKEQKIRIEASSGLSDAEIDKMVKDAEANAEADKKRRELVEARNHADALIHATEQQLAEHGDGLCGAALDPPRSARPGAARPQRVVECAGRVTEGQRCRQPREPQQRAQRHEGVSDTR